MLAMSDLQPGESARVLALKGLKPSFRQQLMAMGLTRGSEFKLLRVAPLGDPFEILVRGSTFCLRRSEVSELPVERVTV